MKVDGFSEANEKTRGKLTEIILTSQTLTSKYVDITLLVITVLNFSLQGPVV